MARYKRKSKSTDSRNYVVAFVKKIPTFAKA